MGFANVYRVLVRGGTLRVRVYERAVRWVVKKWDIGGGIGGWG